MGAPPVTPALTGDRMHREDDSEGWGDRWIGVGVGVRDETMVVFAAGVRGRKGSEFRVGAREDDVAGL